MQVTGSILSTIAITGTLVTVLLERVDLLLAVIDTSVIHSCVVLYKNLTWVIIFVTETLGLTQWVSRSLRLAPCTPFIHITFIR